MKKILISILISISFLSSVDAAILVPSLTAQMARQEQINSKNAYAMRIAEQERKRAEARARVLALKNKKTTATTTTVTNTPVVTSAPVIVSTPSKPVLQISSSLSTAISPANVDMSRVRSAWIGWYNGVRQSD